MKPLPDRLSSSIRLGVNIHSTFLGIRNLKREQAVAGPDVDLRRILPVDAFGIDDLAQCRMGDNKMVIALARPFPVGVPCQFLAAAVDLLLLSGIISYD